MVRLIVCCLLTEFHCHISHTSDNIFLEPCIVRLHNHVINLSCHDRLYLVLIFANCLISYQALYGSTIDFATTKPFMRNYVHYVMLLNSTYEVHIITAIIS